MGKKVWTVMTDTSCGEKALHPGGACSNLSGRGVVSVMLREK